MAKIIFEKNKCIGCGMCSTVCPDHWERGDDNLAHLKEGIEEEGGKFVRTLAEVGCNKEAAQNCPVQCIHVEEEGEE